jgi:hypothetical protein
MKTLVIDKNPIAKIDGKIGIIRLDSLMITTLDDKPLLLIKEHYKMFSLPAFRNFSWYSFNFYTLEKEILFSTT